MNSIDFDYKSSCKIYKQKRVNIAFLVYTFVLANIFFTFSLYAYHRLNIPKELYKDDIFAYKILTLIYHSSIIMGLWYFAHFSLMIITYSIPNDNSLIRFNYLLYRRFSLSFLLCLIIYPLIIHFDIINRKENILENPTDKFDETKNILFDFTMLEMQEKSFNKWVNAINILLGAFIAYDFFGYYLEHYLYHVTFRKRFEQKISYIWVLHRLYIQMENKMNSVDLCTIKFEDIYGLWLKEKRMDIIPKIYEWLVSDIASKKAERNEEAWTEVVYFPDLSNYLSKQKWLSSKNCLLQVTRRLSRKVSLSVSLRVFVLKQRICYRYSEVRENN